MLCFDVSSQFNVLEMWPPKWCVRGLGRGDVREVAVFRGLRPHERVDTTRDYGDSSAGSSSRQAPCSTRWWPAQLWGRAEAPRQELLTACGPWPWTPSLEREEINPFLNYTAQKVTKMVRVHKWITCAYPHAHTHPPFHLTESACFPPPLGSQLFSRDKKQHDPNVLGLDFSCCHRTYQKLTFRD